MKQRKTIIVCMLFLMWAITASSQIITQYTDENALIDEEVKVYVKKISILDNHTHVTIVIKPLYDLKRFDVWTSSKTYLQAGEKRLEYLGAFSYGEQTYHSLEYDDGYGWDDLVRLKEYPYTLVFKGVPDPGVDTVSLIDPNYRNNPGYSFFNLRINNDSIKTPTDEKIDWSKYLAYTTTVVNMRELPSIKSNVIRKLPKESLLVVDKNNKTGNFYFVHDVSNDEEGYVHEKYVEFYKDKVKVQNGNIFIPRESHNQYTNPVLYVKNDSKHTLTLKLNDKKYVFKPNEKKTIHMKAGKCDITASSPGVIPYFGVDNLKNGYDYDWVFYTLIR